MLKWLIIFSTFLPNLGGWAQKTDSVFFNEYMKKGDEKFEEIKNQGKGDFYEAINAYNTAMLIYPEKADSARLKIRRVFIEIQRVSDENEAGKVKIQKTLKEVEKARDDFEEQKKEAEEAREEFYLFNLANAPYKYVRLIRDGPKAADKIKSENFDLNLIAYANHLDTLANILQDSLSKKQEEKIPGAKIEYDHLRESLYYNNELYEKIYYSFIANGMEGHMLNDKIDNPGSEYFTVQHFADGSGTCSLSKNQSFIIGKGTGNGTDSLSREGQIFTSLTLSAKKKVFAATDDHYIFIYRVNEKGMLLPKPEDSIAMGTRVTALDFDEKTNILFFGTKDGDIGYIECDSSKKKYQPVYSTENFLTGSQITAIDIFVNRDSTFLLAAGFGGKGVVYKVDKNNPLSANKFSGNMLPNPKKDLGDILHARFDGQLKGVKFETSNGIIYLWDPFTESVLEKYKMAMKQLYKNGDEKSMKETKLSIMDATNYYKNLGLNE